MNKRGSAAFTLIELLVVVAIIATLIAILMPSLRGARQQSRSVVCGSNLRSLGQGWRMYADEHADRLLPSRLPAFAGGSFDNPLNHYEISTGLKFRPRWPALMQAQVGVPALEKPLTFRNRQNYDSAVYVCPSVADWTDERNAAYGYNYQFLGNSRLFDSSDPGRFKNWPVTLSRITQPSGTVAAADCMGTAATFPESARLPYENNGREDASLGEEGFNLDPPWVDAANGEMAGLDDGRRTAVDPRHSASRGNVVWVDGHAAGKSLVQLGYRVDPDGSIPTVGFTEDNVDNRQWSGAGLNIPWTVDGTGP